MIIPSLPWSNKKRWYIKNAGAIPNDTTSDIESNCSPKLEFVPVILATLPSTESNKEPIINFGKHKGKKVVDVFKKEPGYYAWIMRGDFSQNTKRCFTKIWEDLKK